MLQNLYGRLVRKTREHRFPRLIDRRSCLVWVQASTLVENAQGSIRPRLFCMIYRTGSHVPSMLCSILVFFDICLHHMRTGGWRTGVTENKLCMKELNGYENK
ncbi:hypothetical protein CC2G_000125 [Coprinopsis cinerea AmutBmut pab1-1]|nr:hypothetical protein CC2G_000125 [Coprinopsis cinerea AmutBmut pab1-1]